MKYLRKPILGRSQQGGLRRVNDGEVLCRGEFRTGIGESEIRLCSENVVSLS